MTSPKMPVRQTLSLRDIQLSYLEWNQGKKPLLLLHGLADHAGVWSSLGDYQAQGYHIVAPDLRGHGESGKPEYGYTFADIITDLEALMEYLGWSAANILGHSWSGKLALIWTRQNPARFHSLILVDPFFIGRLPSWMKLTFPILYRTLPFLKAMGPFASEAQAEHKVRQLNQYQGLYKETRARFRQIKLLVRVLSRHCLNSYNFNIKIFNIFMIIFGKVAMS